MQNYFGVGRTVIRESIARLRGRNILEGYQGKGNFVVNESFETLFSRIRSLYKNDIDKLPYLWEMRELLEVQTAGLAAERRTEQDLTNLKSALLYMAKSVESTKASIEQDDRFHYFVTRAAHNPIIEQVMIDLSAMIEPSKRIDLERPFRSKETYQELLYIYEAIEAGNADGSREAMRLHIKNSREEIDQMPRSK